MFYILKYPLTQEFTGVEVWMRICAEYFTLNEEWLKFELVTSCHVGFNIMSKNHFNEKLKLMVEAEGYILYSKRLNYNFQLNLNPTIMS